MADAPSAEELANPTSGSISEADSTMASTVSPFGATRGACAPMTKRERSIGTRVTDQYEWYDSDCQLRTASMVRSDPKGGHAIEFSYALATGRRVLSAAPENGSALPAGGFGYVVSHLADSIGTKSKRHGEDDSPLGLRTEPTRPRAGSVSRGAPTGERWALRR